MNFEKLRAEAKACSKAAAQGNLSANRRRNHGGDCETGSRRRIKNPPRSSMSRSSSSMINSIIEDRAGERGRSNSQIRQRVADAVDDLDELRMGFFETLDGRPQSLQRMVQRLRILFVARGFVGRKLREPGDALRLLVVRLGKLADLGFQRAEQLQQFAFALFADGCPRRGFSPQFRSSCFRS